MIHIPSHNLAMVVWLFRFQNSVNLAYCYTYLSQCKATPCFISHTTGGFLQLFLCSIATGRVVAVSWWAGCPYTASSHHSLVRLGCWKGEISSQAADRRALPRSNLTSIHFSIILLLTTHCLSELKAWNNVFPLKHSSSGENFPTFTYLQSH